jgi:hypothetical protein
MVRVWDMDRECCVATLKGHTGAVYSVALSHDGKRAVTGSVDCAIRFWNLDSEGCEDTLMLGDRQEVWSVALSADGKFLIGAISGKTVRVWSTSEQLHASDMNGARHNIANAKHITSGNCDALGRHATPEPGGGLGRKCGDSDQTIPVCDIQTHCCDGTHEACSGMVLHITITVRVGAPTRRTGTVNSPQPVTPRVDQTHDTGPVAATVSETAAFTMDTNFLGDTIDTDSLYDMMDPDSTGDTMDTNAPGDMMDADLMRDLDQLVWLPKDSPARRDFAYMDLWEMMSTLTTDQWQQMYGIESKVRAMRLQQVLSAAIARRERSA